MWRRTKMKETKTVPFLIESNNGHDEKQVSLGDIQSEVEEQLKQDKWVTIEKKDGSSELLTKQDIPAEDEDDDEEVVDDRDEEDIEADEDAKDQELLAGFKKDTGKAKPINKKTTTATKPATPSVKEEWSSKFEDITSATATAPAKGG